MRRESIEIKDDDMSCSLRWPLTALSVYQACLQTNNNDFNQRLLISLPTGNVLPGILSSTKRFRDTD